VTRRRRGIVVAALLLLVVPVVHAQGAQPVQVAPEARLDVIIARRSALQAALGADIGFSPDLHLELAAGLGGSTGAGAPAGISSRMDAIVRFRLDPQHAMRWSPYVGGGIGARYDRGPGWRGVAILVAGVNGPTRGHAVPFLEAGLGGGFRLGVGVRRGTR
jgi:hypothetical protein